MTLLRGIENIFKGKKSNRITTFYDNKLKMTNKRKHQVSPQNQYQSEQTSSFPWLLSIVGIGGLLFVLQVFDIFKTVDTKRTATIMDVRSGEYVNRQISKERLKKLDKSTPEVEAVLISIKEEYEAPVFTDIRTANDNNNWGLADDEARFYDDMRIRYGGTRENWLGVVQRANTTYKAVKEIFGGRSDVPAILQDSRAASTIFSRIQQQFGISTLDCLNFAQSGNATRLSDWANFVEGKKQ